MRDPDPTPPGDLPSIPGSSKGRLTDERPKGQWETRYPRSAWIQIWCEITYLVGGTTLALLLLYQIAVAAHSTNGPDLSPGAFAGVSRHNLTLGAVAIGGGCGGFAFALKWLYHGVAHGWWNRDRLVWRLVVPLLSGIIALFTALMIGSGLIPILSEKIIEGPRFGAAYGFFAGFFSDNLLAALQRLADQTLGTLGRIEGGRDRRPEA